MLRIILLCLLLASCIHKPEDALYKKKPAFYTYIIGDIHTDHIDIEHKADVYVTPASCQKVIIAMLALKTFGIDYVYETKLYLTEKEAVVSFAGDPKFTLADLDKLLQYAKAQNKTDIVFDASFFKTPEYSQNIVVEDIGSYYVQPVSAIVVDGNIVENFKLEEYLESKLKQIMPNTKLKIIYNPKDLPDNMVYKASVKSETLGEIIKPAFKKSDNLIFDILYLQLARYYYHDPIENWNDGDKMVKGLLAKYFDIDTKSALFIDGSGLTRYNRVQPRILFDILKKGYEVEGVAAIFPSSGEKDTTLEVRSKLPESVKAKTGSMSGINCLCGYANNDKAFVVIANSFAPPIQEARDIIDEFLDHYLRK